MTLRALHKTEQSLTDVTMTDHSWSQQENWTKCVASALVDRVFVRFGLKM